MHRFFRYYDWKKKQSNSDAGCQNNKGQNSMVPKQHNKRIEFNKIDLFQIELVEYGTTELALIITTK
mgnify:CR=1 FL=1